jgi:hypothetical protein
MVHSEASTFADETIQTSTDVSAVYTSPIPLVFDVSGKFANGWTVQQPFIAFNTTKMWWPTPKNTGSAADFDASDVHSRK